MFTSRRVINRVTTCLLLFALCFGGGFSVRTAKAQAGSPASAPSGESATRAAHSGDKVSEKLRTRSRRWRAERDRTEVILRLNGEMSGALRALLRRNGARINKELQRVGVAVAELPASAIEELSGFSEVSYVSPDEETQVLGHVSKTTGMEAAVGQTYTNISNLNGTGVGIAVVDSGIYDAHTAFLSEDGTASRVVFNKNFVATETRTDDPYGHGTHVAGLAAGNKRVRSGAYAGVAPDAKLIDLRVLDSNGKGKTSWLLAALDWIAANHAAYNIRVVNLSLGSPAIDSYKNDPVCKAIEKLYDLNIVVVAAAGNHGKNSYGQKVYGQIHSPGNSPHAITVGASNSFGTDTRTDDKITTYSSRGPTRSSLIDAAGLRRYDNLLKPDLVAPGNKLISAESSPNKLRTLTPSLSAYNFNDQQNAMMYLSGTSMATPNVTGAVALMLEANPQLTSGMVRAILQYTATPIRGYNLLEQGAGQLNVAGAAKLADLVRRDVTATTAVGSALLTAAAPAAQSYLVDRNYTWAQGITFEYNFGTGLDLIAKLQEGYRPTFFIQNDVYAQANGTLVKDDAKLSGGVALGRNIMTSAGGVLGTGTVIPLSLRGSGTLMSDGMLMSDGTLMSDGLLLSDGILMSDGLLLSDGILMSDSFSSIYLLVNGDPTSCMAIAP